ncbi:lipopolysaccharide export system protein LptA [Sphingomonas palmae]|uniref:Lipopolysaccharide export system protein LptA n=1 Tax=Sphingomonas palmae TaxID=1855283 RepID=A0A1H7SDE7_9SPHN|nr:lipopolysaccharide export system protein LptA [Sphingomonas palmae]
MSAMRRSLLTLTLLVVAAPAAAQSKHNTNAPIDFGADQIELQDKANRAVLTGNVAVRQAEMTLNAQRLNVAYTGEVVDGNPQVSRLDASGGVTVRRPDQTARGQYAVYDLNRRVITMLGNVRLTQGPNTVNGARLTINLDTGRAVIDGSAVAGGSGSGTGGNVQRAPTGRVTGTFSVPKRS